MATIPELLELLFSTLPPPKGTADMTTQIRAYGMALDGHDIRDIEAAVRSLIRGEVDWHNGAFAPSAPLLGAAVREAMYARLERERREKPYVAPALASPDRDEPTPEEKARVKALLEGFLKGQNVTPQDDPLATRRQAFAASNARFDQERESEDLLKRLGFGEEAGE